MKKLMRAVTSVSVAAMLLAGCGASAETAVSSSEDVTAGASMQSSAASDSTSVLNAASGTSALAAASESASGESEPLGETEITVFAAKSLSSVMEELIAAYNEEQPNVTITTSYDSSGTLMTQIEEGAACDVFFSAAQKQMDQLQDDDGLVVDGTRHNVVNNQVCVVTYKGSGTEVTGLDTLGKAKSIALADGSVPVGKYTREAMMNAGMLDKADDASTITTQEISDALGGVEINECANVGAVAAAVSEGSDEVGTVYYSDTYGYEDKLEILETISYDLTGDVIYPVAEITNTEADTLETEASVSFINFLTSDTAKDIFDRYHFDTNVED